MKKIKLYLVICLLIIIALYSFGPRVQKSEFAADLPRIDVNINNIDNYIAKYDSGLQIKPDNATKIVWADDSLRKKSEFCLLYLHGFRASWYEGYPADIMFANYFGCNAYYPRLASHGIYADEPLIDMTPDRLWESAKEALVVAKELGDKVIIMGTSTGASLALKLAADFPEDVFGLLLYSPNTGINKTGIGLVTKSWGLQIARSLAGGDYMYGSTDIESKECKYWTCKFRVEAGVFLQQLVEQTMTEETFKKVTQPVFVGYYYKDEEHQDETVKVSTILTMFDELGTSSDLKRKVAFQEAGTHVIACELFSKSYTDVYNETVKFATEVLKMSPIQ